MKGISKRSRRAFASSVTNLEGSTAFALLALLVAAKIIYVFSLRINSDETQHLHVVWGWANGWLPYRDFFDNHSPLFQFLCVPLFRAFGERPDIVVPMRLTMIPLYLTSLWCVFRLGRLFFSRRIGLWAAVCAGAWPQFFLTSTEFRTDDLWTVLWLACLTILAELPLTKTKAFLFGLLVGATFATSMKTSLLVLALLICGVPVVVSRLRRGDLARELFIATAAAAALGLIVLPALVIVFFASHGALSSLYYCTVQHNTLHGLFIWAEIGKRISPISAGLGVGFCTWICYRDASSVGIRSRIAVAGFSVALYLFLIAGCWPLIQVQDYLPIAPIGVLLVLGAVAGRPWRLPWFAPSLCAITEIALLLFFAPPRPGVMSDKIQLIANVLTLTSRDDYVMDSKGEAIYRRRPFYYVLEGITLRRIQLNLIKDEIPEALIETRTPLATLQRMPARAQNFIAENYLPISFRLRALGKILPSAESSGRTFDFDIAVAAEYAICMEHGDVSAECDGEPFAKRKFLEAGRHRLRVAQGGHGRLAIIWARALEKGFSPFAAIKPDNFGGSD
jgi:hypothetical protein